MPAIFDYHPDIQEAVRAPTVLLSPITPARISAWKAVPQNSRSHLDHTSRISFTGLQQAFLTHQTFIPLNKSFPATANLPDRWSFVEEVYYFRSDPRSNGAVVVMTVDEGSYTSAYRFHGVIRGNMGISSGRVGPARVACHIPRRGKGSMSGEVRADQ
jgi:hypothetical protein